MLECQSCNAKHEGSQEKCLKCGARISMGLFKPSFLMWGKFKNHEGVDIEADLFLMVQRKSSSKAGYRVKLIDQRRDTQLTTWLNLRDLENIKTSASSKILRNKIKERYSNHQEAIEQIIIAVENHEEKIPKSVINFKSEEADFELVEEGKPVKFVPSMELDDGRLVEQAFDGKVSFFLVYDPKKDIVTRRKKIELKDSILRPIDNEEVKTKTVLLPSGVIEYSTEEQLMEEVLRFLNYWHEPPSKIARILDILYVFLTYVQILIPQIPYRRYLAPWGRGKSAWLESIGYICYRPIILAGSDTDKSIVRKMNNWRGTALIDEADFGNSSYYAFIVKILNIGYDQKTAFYHRSDDKDPYKTLSYCVFGAKIIVNRGRYKDIALESRCLTTIGRQNTNPVPLFRMEKFQNEAQALRNKLILWRFRNYHRIKKAVKKLENPTIADKVYQNARNLSSRVKQIILPLWLIAGDKMRDALIDLAKFFDNRLKTEDPDYLLELQAKEAVTRLVAEYEDDPGRVNVKNILNIVREPSDENMIFYEIKLSAISRRILEIRGIKDDEINIKQTTSISKQIKRIFESNLGFNIRIGKARRRVVMIPENWILTQEQEKPLKELDLFFEDISKNVQEVHNVHPEQEKNGRDDEKTAQSASIYSVRKVETKKLCELCGKSSTKYEITRPDGAILSRCQICFNKFRSKATKIKWRYIE